MMNLTMNVQIADRVFSVPVIIADSDAEVNVNLADEPLFLRNEGRIFFGQIFMNWLLTQNDVEPTTDNIDNVIEQVIEAVEG